MLLQRPLLADCVEKVDVDILNGSRGLTLDRCSC